MMTKVKEVIEIPEAVCAGHLWLATDLVETHPITNELEWELAKLKGYETMGPKHFVSMIENPLNDPWGRKLIPWMWDLSNVEMEWEELKGGSVGYRLETQFRYSTVAGKPLCLYRYKLIPHG